jgi:WD40 repeat protein
MSRSQKWWCLLLWAAFVLSPRAWSQPPTPPEPKPLEDKLPRTDSDGGPLPPHALARLGILSFRHRGFVAAPFVEAVAFSADGKTLATLGGDGSVCIWEASTGRFMRQFGYRIPKGLSYHLSFSSDGQKLAVRAGMESNVWDVATGKEIPLRRPWRDPNIFSIVFAPDGKILALEQNTIYLRETATDKDIRTLARKDGGGFSAMLFSPDGKMLLGSAPSSWRHAIYFWDASTGEEIRKIEANEYYTRAPRLALSPDGKVLATGGSPIHLWEVATGKELGVIKNAGEQFTFSPDSKTLASW